MKQIRHDFAPHAFKAWLARLIRRVDQMHLLTSSALEQIAAWRATSRKGYSPGRAPRDEGAHESPPTPRLPQAHRSSA
jgi:hypothetical protein